MSKKTKNLLRILSSWAVPWRCQPFSFRNSDSLIFLEASGKIAWVGLLPARAHLLVELPGASYVRVWLPVGWFHIILSLHFVSAVDTFLPCIHNIYIYLPILPYGRSFAPLFLYHLILLLCKTCTSIFCSVRMDLWWLQWPWQSPHLSQHSCTIYPFLRAC